MTPAQLTRKLFLTLSLFALSFSALAQLSTAQLNTTHTALCLDASAAALINAGDSAGLRSYANANASPAFIAWKSTVTITASGQAFNGTEWAGMTSANHTRLQTVAQYLQSYNPGLADVRGMFNDIWSGAGGVVTRANLLALWKRSSTRVEKALATGTGSDASPATLTWEGPIQETDGARLVFRDNGTLWGC